MKQLIHPVAVFFLALWLSVGSASASSSWSDFVDSPNSLAESQSQSTTTTNDEAPLIEDLSGLMKEIERLSEWDPMDAGGSTGPTGNTTTTTTTAPSPYPPAVNVLLRLSADGTMAVANNTWLALFVFQLDTLLGIPTSEFRIVAIAATSSGAEHYLTFVIAASTISTDPSPATLAENLLNDYSQFLMQSSVQYVQVISTQSPVLTDVFQCPDGTFQQVCTSTPAPSSSNSIDTFWFYVIGIGCGVGLIVIGTVVYFASCRSADSRLKNEEFRGVELQYEAPFSTSGQPIIGSSSAAAAAASRQQGLFEEVTLHELEAQQAQHGGVRRKDISVG